MKKCRERVKWIMFQDRCALIDVRFDGGAGGFFGNLSIDLRLKLDCDVDQWVGKHCIALDCFDSCPDIQVQQKPTNVEVGRRFIERSWGHRLTKVA